MNKITMLGVSNSGKTCFIYAMYDFMQYARNGFSFITKDPNTDLDLSEGWHSIALDGIWPDGTQGTTSYEFCALFKSQNIMEFSWLDYRGGALLERTSDAEVTELLNRINESECLIISIGADTIKGILAKDYSKQRELNRLNFLIARFGAETKRRIPLIFALTKADLYSQNEYGQLLGIIQQYFSSLYQRGSGWLHAIVPVTLGRFEESSGNKIRGVVEPKNIHIPVMFFLHSILKERIEEIRGKLKRIKIDRDKYRSEIPLGKGKPWWSKLWNGDITKQLNGKINNLDEDENNILLELKDLESAFNSMEDMFKVCKVFYEGQPVSM